MLLLKQYFSLNNKLVQIKIKTIYLKQFSGIYLQKKISGVYDKKKKNAYSNSE